MCAVSDCGVWGGLLRSSRSLIQQPTQSRDAAAAQHLWAGLDQTDVTLDRDSPSRGWEAIKEVRGSSKGRQASKKRF